jgi:hypothetical protein
VCLQFCRRLREYVVETCDEGVGGKGGGFVCADGDGASGDNFGYSVSISGDTLVVGANGKNSGAGAGYVFDVTCPPTLTKSFGAPSIPLNGTTSLTFTITNPNPSKTLTGMGFTDTLPSGGVRQVLQPRVCLNVVLRASQTRP